jgi:prepilin-type N-terminal cleavage/methylation domain-containing protein
MKTKKGFTLVELLVVISIIAILLAVLIPSMNRAKEAAKRTICGSQQKQIGVALMAYIGDYHDSLPFYGGWDPSWQAPFWAGTGKDELHPYAAYRGDKSPWVTSTATVPWTVVPLKMGCLHKGGFIKDAKVFYCPSNKDKNYVFDSYTNPLLPQNTSKEWGTLPQKYNTGNQWVRVGYAYYPIDESLKWDNGGMQMVGGNYVPRYTARTYGKLSKNFPYLTDVLWTRADVSHKSGYVETSSKISITNAGVNALFKDGHVRYNKDGPVTYYKVGDDTPYSGPTLFDNEFWTAMDPPGNAPQNDGLDIRFLLYYLYKDMIKP